jgi:hypothetical protein
LPKLSWSKSVFSKVSAEAGANANVADRQATSKIPNKVLNFNFSILLLF